MVDFLETKKKSKESIFFKYLDISGSDDFSILFLIESNDESYYRHCIEPTIHTSKPLYFFRCNGRDNVLKLYEDITSSEEECVKNTNFYCFIDKDFNENEINTDKEKIYITPCYSYENFYCSESATLKILKSKFHLDKFCENNEDYINLVAIHNSRLNEYIDIIKKIDEILRTNFINNKYFSNKLKSKLRANDIKINKISINFNCIQLSDDILSIFPQYFSIELLLSFAFYEASFYYLHTEIEQYINQLRGKFLIHFQITFFKLIYDDFKSNNPIIFKHRKKLKDDYQTQGKSSSHLYDLDFNKNSIESFTDTFCAYADIPTCLRQFIQSISVTANLQQQKKAS